MPSKPKQLIFYRDVLRESIATYFGKDMPAHAAALAFYMIFSLPSMLFALFFRYLPDVKLDWKDIWFGAFVTAGLFTGGKYLIGYVIGSSRAADLYEAAGSVLVLMLWVYYASAIFLFGATFTFTRARLLNNGH